MPSHDPTGSDRDSNPSPSAARRNARPDSPFLQAYFANIVALSEDAIISVGVDQRIRLFNRGAEVMFGYPEGDVLGQPLGMLLPDRFRAAHQSHVSQFAASGEHLRPMGTRPTIVGRRKDGTEFPAEATITQLTAHGETVLTVRLRDVTAAEQAAQIRARLAAIVEAAEEAVISKSVEGIITAWNPAAERLFGYKATDAIGQAITIIIPPERQAEADAVSARIQRGEEVARLETVRVTEAGQRIDIALTVVPMRDAQGQLIGASKIARDLSEQKRAEAALRQAHDELERRVEERTRELANALTTQAAQAEQVRILGGELALAEQRERQRLSQLLHDDLQQLLVAVRLRVNMLQAADPARVLDARTELLELVEAALTFSRSLSAELSPTILQTAGFGPALEWLVRWMDDTHHLKVALTIAPAVEPDSPATKGQLFQFVRELLFNVVKHAGVLHATVDVFRADAHLQIVVADRGVGFDPGRIATGGRGGLGLPSIRQRLEYLGGRLEIASVPGHGSRFTLSIPPQQR